MGKYFSIGQFNKYYFFILGSITIRIIIGFMLGFTPYLSPNDTIFLLGFKSILFSHPLISNCFEYFAIAFGGIILDFIYSKVNKNNYDVNPNENDKFSDNKSQNKDVMNSSDVLDSSKLSEFNMQLKDQEIKRENYILYLRAIFLLYFFYFFAKFSMSSLDNLGYNRVKYWPLEFIFLYYFLRKIIGKKLYKHQLISLSIILIFCTSIYTLNSFFPYTNENCDDLVEESKKNECKMLSVNIYKDIINKLGTEFVPIIIIIYFLAMICNAYSAIKNKWFMDFKFITTYKILTYLGIIGLFFSIILLIISSYLPCPKNTIFIQYICKIKYNDSNYYDNFRSLIGTKINYQFFLDVFFQLPLFLILSFLYALFELIIIYKLDPFYLIPIDCVYFLIYEIIDYCITFSKRNLYRNIKFFFQVTSNTVSVLVCCVYLEIFELHFCNLDQYVRSNIIKRERIDNNSIIELMAENDEAKNKKNEINCNNENDGNEEEENSIKVSFEGYYFKIKSKKKNK